MCGMHRCNAANLSIVQIVEFVCHLAAEIVAADGKAQWQICVFNA